MNLTIYGRTYHVRTEAELIRLLLALHVLQALMHRKAA